MSFIFIRGKKQVFLLLPFLLPVSSALAKMHCPDASNVCVITVESGNSPQSRKLLRDELLSSIRAMNANSQAAGSSSSNSSVSRNSSEHKEKSPSKGATAALKGLDRMRRMRDVNAPKQLYYGAGGASTKSP